MLPRTGFTRPTSEVLNRVFMLNNCYKREFRSMASLQKKRGSNSSSEKLTRLKDIPTDDMNREQLLARIRQLESNVTNLRNVIAKRIDDKPDRPEIQHKKSFDFTKYNTRHVLLKFAYFGWEYSGFAIQEETTSTIEAEIFRALVMTRLIESRQTSNYHRCGRTDKGVSAFSQVISIDLRSNQWEGVGVNLREGLTLDPHKKIAEREISYCEILNRVLPQNIRMLAWCPVQADISARFDCIERTYKYFFPKADMNLELMSEGAKKLIGCHDFRNLAKMDVGNGVVEFIRRIDDIYVNTVEDSSQAPDPYTMCVLTIVGSSFLWHQVRCLVSILFMVGRGQEKPEIIDTLLDVEKTPRKPQYQMAAELPLVLYDCQYDNINWITDQDAHQLLVRTLQTTWAQTAVKERMMRSVLHQVEAMAVTDKSGVTKCWSECLPPAMNQLREIHIDRYGSHIALLQREKCDSLEQRIKYFAKRRKTDFETTSNTNSDQMEIDTTPELSNTGLTKVNTVSQQSEIKQTMSETNPEKKEISEVKIEKCIGAQSS